MIFPSDPSRGTGGSRPRARLERPSASARGGAGVLITSATPARSSRRGTRDCRDLRVAADGDVRLHDDALHRFSLGVPSGKDNSGAAKSQEVLIVTGEGVDGLLRGRLVAAVHGALVEVAVGEIPWASSRGGRAGAVPHEPLTPRSVAGRDAHRAMDVEAVARRGALTRRVNPRSRLAPPEPRSLKTRAGHADCELPTAHEGTSAPRPAPSSPPPSPAACSLQLTPFGAAVVATAVTGSVLGAVQQSTTPRARYD